MTLGGACHICAGPTRVVNAAYMGWGHGQLNDSSPMRVDGGIQIAVCMPCFENWRRRLGDNWTHQLIRAALSQAINMARDFRDGFEKTTIRIATDHIQTGGEGDGRTETA